MKSGDVYKTIGNKIKETRERAGMSQNALAKALGYHSATAISLIESGDRKVEVEILQKIAGLLHMDIKFFLGKDTSTPTINYALRADKKLTQEDEKQILNFIDFVKKQDGR